VLIIAQTYTEKSEKYHVRERELTYRLHVTDMVDEISFSQVHCDLKRMKNRESILRVFVLASQVETNMLTSIKPTRQQIHLKVRRILKSNIGVIKQRQRSFVTFPLFTGQLIQSLLN
jgi:hypothetical protein